MTVANEALLLAVTFTLLARFITSELASCVVFGFALFGGAGALTDALLFGFVTRGFASCITGLIFEIGNRTGAGCGKRKSDGKKKNGQFFHGLASNVKLAWANPRINSYRFTAIRRHSKNR